MVTKVGGIGDAVKVRVWLREEVYQRKRMHKPLPCEHVASWNQPAARSLTPPCDPHTPMTYTDFHPILPWLLPQPSDLPALASAADPPTCAGFCKQQLWPLFHYILPVSPLSSGRFDIELWQAYVKANMVRAGVLWVDA